MGRVRNPASRPTVIEESLRGAMTGAAEQEQNGLVDQATSPQKTFEEPPCRWVCIRRTLAESGWPWVARKSRSLRRACPRAPRNRPPGVRLSVQPN